MSNIVHPIPKPKKKNPLKSPLLIFLIFIFVGLIAEGQQVIRQVPCYDSSIKNEVDSLKASLSGQGFTLVREASMTMESGYEMPVFVPLNQGTWYQFSFIGDVSSRLCELRMYNYDDKQVVYQKRFWDDPGGNVISFSYIPQITEYHVLKPVQVNKKKKENICGVIMMFKKVKPIAQR